jgi:lipoate-protein ligase A
VNDERWPLEHLRGSAAAFHARDVPDPAVASMWWFEVEQPAVVLGSTQRDDVIDVAAATAGGIEVARRRSGGGAVFLEPGGALWIDVILPASDPRWDRDVGRSFGWLGRAWAEVVHQLGLPGPSVHEGPLLRRPWSDRVCFAGLGPGEVTVDGQKVVGISQRRTRSAARFQCALLRHWDPGPLISVLALEASERDQAATDLGSVGRGVGPVSGERVVSLLRAAIIATD